MWVEKSLFFVEPSNQHQGRRSLKKERDFQNSRLFCHFSFSDGGPGPIHARGGTEPSQGARGPPVNGRRHASAEQRIGRSPRLLSRRANSSPAPLRGFDPANRDLLPDRSEPRLRVGQDVGIRSAVPFLDPGPSTKRGGLCRWFFFPANLIFDILGYVDLFFDGKQTKKRTFIQPANQSNRIPSSHGSSLVSEMCVDNCQDFPDKFTSVLARIETGFLFAYDSSQQ